jgi:hypothetical protein
VDIVERDDRGPITRPPPRLGRRGLGQQRDLVQPGERAAGGGQRPLAEIEDPTDRLQRPDELEQKLDEERQIPVAHRAVDHRTTAEEQHQRD